MVVDLSDQLHLLLVELLEAVRQVEEPWENPEDLFRKKSERKRRREEEG